MATSRIKSPVLQYILDKDVILTKKFVAFLLNFTTFKSLRVHCKFLEYSCDGIVWLASWLAFIWIANSKRLYEMQFNFLLGLLLDIFIIAILKSLVRRRRPVPTKDMLTIGPDKFSFPSGHASRAFLIWSFFILLRDVPVLFWMPLTAWCTSVCLSRLILQRHYILDVAAGALLGLIEALIINIIWIGPEFAQGIINIISEDHLPEGSE